VVECGRGSPDRVSGPGSRFRWGGSVVTLFF
jgi:hypothetical protein